MEAAAAAGDFQGFEEDDDDIDEELDPMTYRDSWTQTRPQEEPAERGIGLPPAQAERDGCADGMSDFDAYYGEDDEEPYFEGVGTSGFSGVGKKIGGGGGVVAGDSAAGRRGQRQQWERVSGRPRPRRRPPTAAPRIFEADVGSGGDFYESGGGRVRRETNFRAGQEGRGGGGMQLDGAGEVLEESRMAEGRKKGR